MQCNSKWVLYKCAYCLHDAFIMIMSGNDPQFNTSCLNIMTQACAVIPGDRNVYLVRMRLHRQTVWTLLTLQVSHKHPEASPRQPQCWYFLCKSQSARYLHSQNEGYYYQRRNLNTLQHTLDYAPFEQRLLTPSDLIFLTITGKFPSLSYPSSIYVPFTTSCVEACLKCYYIRV